MEGPTLHEWAVEVTSVSLQRFDKRLTDEMAAMRWSVQQELAALRDEVRRGNSSLREEIRTQRREALKWSIICWIGQAAATAAIVGGLFALGAG